MEGFNVDDTDFGLDLLINNRKKQSADAISSRSSHREYNNNSEDSIKSVEMHSSKPNGVHVEERSYPVEESEEESSVLSYQPRQPTSRSPPRVVTSDDDNESEPVHRPNRNSHYLSEDEVFSQKTELLYQFDRLEKKGYRIPRKFNMSSSIEDMKYEYERLKQDKQTDASIKFQRRMMLACVSGIEYMNDRFDPFDIKLSGWSETVNDDIEDYDDIFEELHEKYKGKANIAPELRLMFMLGGSGFMFHLSSSMKSSIPGLDQVLKNNPGLMRQVAEATANQMHTEQKQTGGPFAGLAGMFGGMFGQKNNEPQAPRTPPTYESSEPDSPKFREPTMQSSNTHTKLGRQPASPVQQQRMNIERKATFKGPQGVESLLAELDLDISRVELMSNVSESEISGGDDASISGLILGKTKNKKKKGKTLEI